VGLSYLVHPRATRQAITTVTQRQMGFKDKRVQASDEALHGMRALKMLAWEGVFWRLIGGVRADELRYLAKRKYLDAW
jgi:hypothetical protein